MKIWTILDLANTIYANFAFLPFKQAIKFPLLVSYKVKFKIHGKIIIESNNISPSMVILGKRGFEAICANNCSKLVIGRGGVLKIAGKACISDGFSVWIDENASITLGDNFYVNSNFQIRCHTSFTTGCHFLGGWNISINDFDGHDIIIDNEKSNNKGPVVIGDNVWIASYCTICKNVDIPSGCVIGQNSLVIRQKSFLQPNSLLVGVPAKVVRTNIEWIE